MRDTTSIGLVWFQALDFLSCNACWVLQFSASTYCLFLSQRGMCRSLPRISTDNSSLSLLHCNPSKKPGSCPLPFLLATLLPAVMSLPQTHLLPPLDVSHPTLKQLQLLYRPCKRILPCPVCSVEYYVILEDRHFCFAPAGNARWCQKDCLSSLGLKHLSISFLFCMFLEETVKHSNCGIM